MQGGIRRSGQNILALNFLLLFSISALGIEKSSSLNSTALVDTSACENYLTDEQEKDKEASNLASQDLFNLSLKRSRAHIEQVMATRDLPDAGAKIEDELIDMVISTGVSQISAHIGKVRSLFVKQTNHQSDKKWTKLRGIHRWTLDNQDTIVTFGKTPIYLDDNKVFPRVDVALIKGFVENNPEDLKHFKSVPLSELDTFSDPAMREAGIMVLKKNIENVISSLDKKLKMLSKNPDEEISEKISPFAKKFETLRQRYINYLSSSHISEITPGEVEEQIIGFYFLVGSAYKEYFQMIDETLTGEKEKKPFLKVTALLDPMEVPQEFEKKTNDYVSQTVARNISTKLNEDGREWTKNSLENYTNGDHTDLDKIGKDLNAYLTETWAELKNTISLDYLKSQFPKDFEKVNAQIQTEINRSQNTEDIFPLAKINKQGHPQVLFKDPKLAARFEPELSTLLLHSPQEMFPKKRAPLWSIHHGYGTDQSKAKSFANSIAKLEAVGLVNVIAHDMPVAGMGIPLEDPNPLHAGTYADMVGEYLSKSQIEQQGEQLPLVDGVPFAPIIGTGRSAGSTKQNIRDFTHPFSRVDIRMNTAFSNPLTIKEQLEHVYHEVELGLIGNIDEPALNYIRDLDLAFMDMLKASTPQKREEFNLIQLLAVYVIGEADEDGGETVLQDNETYAKKYTPLAHRWYIRDPLKGTTFADEDSEGYLKHFNFLESKHHLLNPHENVTASRAKERFPELPHELWPKTGNQLSEIMSVSYAMMDMIISLEELLSQAVSDDPHIQKVLGFLLKKSQKLKAYREYFLADENAETLFDWYVAQRSVSPQAVAEADPQHFFAEQVQILKEFKIFEKTGQKGKTTSGINAAEYQQQDLVNRFAKVQRYFFNTEPRRVKRFFSKHGYIK